MAAALHDESGLVVARQGELVELSQVEWDSSAGTYVDPYIASGGLFNGCYPYVP